MEHIHQFLIYFMTLFLAAILPGPGMTGLMFKTLSQGYRAGVVMLSGLITGDILYLTVSIFLLGYLNQLSPSFAFYLVIFSSLYLLYLSSQFWRFKGDLLEVSLAFNTDQAITAYRDGLLITLSNPKTISFYLALVPAIFSSVSIKDKSILLTIVTILTLILVGGLYIFCSFRLKQVLKNIKVQKILLKSLALMMSFLALSLLYKELLI
ncbi:LysE family translocator [Acinetobacter sp. 1207_04]|uniref:LysE family translocator n=1 Tax=Acinetobacter sp. 1207_04 TaxID=2604449 RepID=UPI00302F40E5